MRPVKEAFGLVAPAQKVDNLIYIFLNLLLWLCLGLSGGMKDLLFSQWGLVAWPQVGSHFPDQGWKPHLLHGKADSYLLYHQGSLGFLIFPTI